MILAASPFAAVANEGHPFVEYDEKTLVYDSGLIGVATWCRGGSGGVVS